jgi:hypothetical protein
MDCLQMLDRVTISRLNIWSETSFISILISCEKVLETPLRKISLFLRSLTLGQDRQELDKAAKTIEGK